MNKGFSAWVGETFVTNVLAAVFGLASGVLLARLLGPSARGEFALVTTGMVLAATMAQVSVSQAVVYFTPQQSKQQLAVNSLVFSLLVGVIVLGGGLVVVAAWPLREELRQGFQIGLLSAPAL